jgi:hypothetical protein
MIFDDRFSGTSLDTAKSTSSLGLERPSGTTALHRSDQAFAAETARLTRLARLDARLAFALRWSARRRRRPLAPPQHPPQRRGHLTQTTGRR